MRRNTQSLSLKYSGSFLANNNIISFPPPFKLLENIGKVFFENDKDLTGQSWNIGARCEEVSHKIRVLNSSV